MDKGVFHANPENGQGNGTIRVTCDAGSVAGNNIFYVKDRSGQITRQIVVKRNAEYVPPILVRDLEGYYNSFQNKIKFKFYLANAASHPNENIYFKFISC